MTQPLCATLERLEPAATATDRLAALFDAHHERLFRLARRLAGDREEARDLVQETFLRAARRPASLPPDESGGEAWLVRTLVNLCRDRHRRLLVRRRVGLAQRGDQELPRHPEAAAVAGATVRRALALLPPRRRAVVVLHELEGVPAAAVARLLGITQVTVRWHLAAARKQLAAALAGGAGGRP